MGKSDSAISTFKCRGSTAAVLLCDGSEIKKDYYSISFDIVSKVSIFAEFPEHSWLENCGQEITACLENFTIAHV